MVLAGATLLLGFLEHPLKAFLDGHAASEADSAAGGGLGVTLPTLTAAIAGLGLAWFEFGRRGAPRTGFVDRMPVVQRLFAERWYLDHAYRILVDRVVDRSVSAWCFETDNKVIDGGVDGVSRSAVETGSLLALFHTGGIQGRMLVTFAVIVFLSLYYFLG